MSAIKYRDPVSNTWLVVPGSIGPQGPQGIQGPPGPSDGTGGTTVDTFEPYKIVMFADGRCKAIPVGATPPLEPTALGSVATVNQVRLTWTAPIGGAASYIVYRNGVQIGTTTQTKYRDRGVTVDNTYTYTVRALDTYGQYSLNVSNETTAFVDPALNNAPVVEIRTWPPTTFGTDARCLVRVNAFDVDVQTLALSLGVDVGSLVATNDVSVWVLVGS